MKIEIEIEDINELQEIMFLVFNTLRSDCNCKCKSELQKQYLDALIDKVKTCESKDCPYSSTK